MSVGRILSCKAFVGWTGVFACEDPVVGVRVRRKIAPFFEVADDALAEHRDAVALPAFRRVDHASVDASRDTQSFV